MVRGMIEPVSWLEGYAAHKHGARLESCPFNQGPNRGEWMDGWYWRARESEGLVGIEEDAA